MYKELEKRWTELLLVGDGGWGERIMTSFFTQLKFKNQFQSQSANLWR